MTMAAASVASAVSAAAAAAASAPSAHQPQWQQRDSAQVARGRLSSQEHSGGLLHEIAASEKRTRIDRRCSAETTRGTDDQWRCRRCSSVRAVRLELSSRRLEAKGEQAPLIDRPGAWT
jgi:hypothetical protein